MNKKIAIIGAGLFGITAALELSKYHDVDLYEKNDDILKAASGINQFRLHRGYHYPRSKKTALSSLKGEANFTRVFGEALIQGTENYYCIAKNDSYTTSKQYISFCKEIGLEFKEVDLGLIDKSNIDLCIKANERLIDSVKLKSICSNNLAKSKVNLLLNTKASFDILDEYDFVVLCTYSNTNNFLKIKPLLQRDYQFELVEKIIVKLPSKFNHRSIVILDGPFMCVDPYGKTPYFLMGNVTHAIHSSNVGRFPKIQSEFKKLLDAGVIKNPPITNFKDFITSTVKFIPEISKAKHFGSMFTIRTVLPYKEKTDERPTIVRKIDKKIFTVFSGKLITCVDASKDLVSYIA
ncbi:hypothetical protein A2164_03765 [Candidatus Curtissbacteria bacterium RBG_13_35_7]|uniref:FAD dependent oxidoreductase domain-containing protein n=1 Tax=Candidatus Curtissbacteria bacterium RBG_13_35_7 TaxID=1797705 RepID=A0A1F5G363_9BACT|nr:MAG: hypothetical protein A2164_03765 [Candidatus Curtissbacteria bacterium RBG_13_35_7]